MDIRSPRANRDTGVKRQDSIGLMRCRADRWAIIVIARSALGRQGIFDVQSCQDSLMTRSRGGCHRRRRRKFDVHVPDGPHDPAEFVGHGDRGFVVTAPVGLAAPTAWRRVSGLRPATAAAPPAARRGRRASSKQRR